MIRAVVPAKTLAEAKGRLASILSVSERREFVLSMLDDVLTALLSVRAISGVSVVSPDREVLGLAGRLGATPIAESANVRGMNQALNRAVSAMSPAPDALIVVLADLPEITRADVERLLAELPEHGAAACPSSDGGTSALALQPPGVIPFCFGPDSFAAHRREAQRSGVEFREVRLQSLALDMDTPEDLRDLLSRPALTATQRLLDRMKVADRLAVA